MSFPSPRRYPYLRNIRPPPRPGARKPKMATKLFGRDLKEYEEVDIDTLLSKLSTEELEELNNDVDPDNALLPPSQRCRDQTTKSPTGPFQRQKLLKFLEEKAKSEPDLEERVPFEPGLKRGSIWKPKESSVGIESGPNDMPIELDVDDEFDTALGKANDSDLVDLAGILGMHSMLSQAQYYNALKGKPQDPDNASFSGIVKSTLPKLIPSEPPNRTDVEDCIKRLSANDEDLTEVNVNNMKEISKERIHFLIESCKNNNHIQKLSMANIGMKDEDVKPLVDVLESNESISSLNIESNFITGDMLVQLIQATLKNQTLKEFHAENQRAIVLGNKVEMEIMKAIEENDSLLRVGIAFQSMEARHRVSEALERNYERLRLKRIGADID